MLNKYNKVEETSYAINNKCCRIKLENMIKYDKISRKHVHYLNK